MWFQDFPLQIKKPRPWIGPDFPTPITVIFSQTFEFNLPRLPVSWGLLCVSSFDSPFTQTQGRILHVPWLRLFHWSWIGSAYLTENFTYCFSLLHIEFCWIMEVCIHPKAVILKHIQPKVLKQRGPEFLLSKARNALHLSWVEVVE